MKAKLIHSKFKHSILYMLILCFVFIFVSVDLPAQYSYNKYLSIKKEEKAKNFIDLLFKINNPKKSRQKKHNKTSRTETSKIKKDTSKNKNKIESLRDGGDIFYLYLELADRESRISIMVYNMLGKKVLDVYEGTPRANGVPYEIYIDSPSSLPNGVYLCVVVGKNFRLREKFVVSRR